jgi:Methane oxygenase PmoA
MNPRRNLRHPGNTRNAVACRVALAGSLILSLAMPAQAQKVKLVPQDGAIDVTIDGKPFTTYHYNDDYFHSPVRPFLYPVAASDGTVVTTDQQQTDPAHGYQRSIWIGHADVNGTNQWKFTQMQAVQKHVRFKWIRRDSFEEELIWTNKDGAPMLREFRTLRFHAWSNAVRGIDLKMELAPLSGDVVFGTRGDHGLLSVRAVESLYHAPVFTAADGSHSCEAPLPPKRTADHSAGAEPVDAIPGVHVAWCDESGQINGQTYGIAIFDHPSNPRHPPMWHAHPDARLATDMFAPDREATGDQQQGPLTIPAGAAVTFRYEILVHMGPAAQANLPAKFAVFAGAP